MIVANLLQNASFESSSAGWRANNLASAVNLQQYKSSHYPAPFSSYVGSGFLEMNTSQPGGSVAQDVTISTQPGQSFSFSVWLRAAPGQNPVSGSVALWGLGGTQENGSTNFTVGQAWTLVTAAVDVQNSGHTSLRAEIYMTTTGANFDACGAQLINAGLQNASFESSSAGWRANNLASAVNLQQYKSSHYPAPFSSYVGSGFLEMNTSQPGGSVAQDVTISTQPGQSFSFSVWLRAAPGQNPVSGSVALWGLGGTQENGSTNFTVGQAWTLVTAAVDVQNSGHTSLRAEIYMTTTGANFDACGAHVPLVATVPAPGAGLGSNSNYLLSNCSNITGLSVTIDVTQAIAGSDGFGFQVNCYSGSKDFDGAQQYLIYLSPSGSPQLTAMVDNWHTTSSQLINTQPELASLPSHTLPAGYKLKISLSNDSSGNITGATYQAWDNNGNSIGEVTITLLSLSGVTQADLAPIVSFQLNLVDYLNGNNTVLSSGAGLIIYSATSDMTVLNTEPSCVDFDFSTEETANSQYGLLSSTVSESYTQSFNYVPGGASIRKISKVMHVTKGG